MTTPLTSSSIDLVAAYFTPDRFRREYGRLVAWLVARFTLSASIGTDTRIDTTEAIQQAQDIAQDSLLAAMRSWPQHGLPENPSAWLTQVAKHRALDLLRRNNRTTTMPEREFEIFGSAVDPTEASFSGELTDDSLRLLFLCCHPSLSLDAQLAFTLQVVAGFSAPEIARTFLADERTIAQRIVRAKKTLREDDISLEIPHGDALPERVEAVLKTLYVLFNEGYLSASGNTLTRPELCREAERLLSELLGHEIFTRQSHLLATASALMALFHFQLARLPARIDAGGELVILEEQDRSRYDSELINSGFHWLERAGYGDKVTPYHLEALILSCHLRAADLQQTDWQTIIECYDTLLSLTPSPVVQLNRVVASAFRDGPRTGLEKLFELADDSVLQRFHLYHAVHADFLRRLNRTTEARESYQRALELTENERERNFLRRRMDSQP